MAGPLTSGSEVSAVSDVFDFGLVSPLPMVAVLKQVLFILSVLFL